MAKQQGSSNHALRPEELSTLFGQLGLLLRAGILVNEGLDILAGDTSDATGKIMLLEILSAMDEGASLAQALEHTGAFPEYVLNMVRIGEASGRLDDVFDALYTYYQRQESMTRSVRSAVTYPLVMLAMMAGVMAVLLVKVMPVFGEVFESLGSEMSGVSQSLLRMGQALGRYAGVIATVSVVLVAVFLLFRATTNGKRTLKRIRQSFFATKRLYGQIAVGHFVSAFSMMLASGLDTDQSLELAEALVEHSEVQEQIKHCRKQIQQGVPLPEAMTSSGLFSGANARLIAVGHRTGALEEVMKRMADTLSEETERSLQSLVGILEPTLVAILSVMVGMILLSVMMPLMGIMASIG